MDSGEILGSEDDLTDGGSAARDEVDDSGRHTGLFVNFHQIVVREYGGGGGLPDYGIAHQGGRHAQVRSDGGEIERGEGEYESFEGTVFHTVDLSGGVLGLESVDLRGIGHVIAQEVDGLAGGIDFRLIYVLALSEHTGCIYYGTVFSGQQVGDFQVYGGTGGPGKIRPLLMCVESGLYGHFDFFFPRFMICGQNVAVPVGHDDGAGVSCTDFLATYYKGYVEGYAALSFQFRFESDTFGTAFQIGFHRFVGRDGKCIDLIVHDSIGNISFAKLIIFSKTEFAYDIYITFAH